MIRGMFGFEISGGRYLYSSERALLALLGEKGIGIELGVLAWATSRWRYPYL